MSARWFFAGFGVSAALIGLGVYVGGKLLLRDLNNFLR